MARDVRFTPTFKFHAKCEESSAFRTLFLWGVGRTGLTHEKVWVPLLNLAEWGYFCEICITPTVAFFFFLGFEDSPFDIYSPSIVNVPWYAARFCPGGKYKGVENCVFDPLFWTVKNFYHYYLRRGRALVCSHSVFGIKIILTGKCEFLFNHEYSCWGFFVSRWDLDMTHSGEINRKTPFFYFR